MIKQKLATSILAGLLTLQLSGCGSSGGGDSIDVAPDSGSQTGSGWQDISAEHSIPAGVKLFEGKYEGSQVEYLQFDLANDALALRVVNADTAQGISQFTKPEGVIAAINGGFFGGNSSYSAAIDGGEVLARNITALTRNSQPYPVLRSTFWVNQEQQAQVDWTYQYSLSADDIYAFTAPLSYQNNDSTPQAVPDKTTGTQLTEVQTAVGGGPRLVEGGAINISYDEEIFWGSGVNLGDSRPRTAICATAQNNIIMLTAHSLSLGELADLMLSLECDNAMNLDGGGSTAMSLADEVIYDQGRAVVIGVLIVDTATY